MKSLGIATAILAATIALAGCKNRKEEPIPGPKAAQPPATESVQPASAAPSSGQDGAAPGPSGSRRHGASGISWFQGTLEEAFSTSCEKCTAMFWHEAMDTAFDR